MINSFIDPIFLAVKDASLYSEEIYPIFCKFFKKIKFLEKKLGNRFIEFNFNQDLIFECYNHSPFQINQVKGNKSWNKWFKGVLEQLFRIYRNNKCEDVVQNQAINFEFSNKHVPISMMEKWNNFLNNCLNCNNSNVPCNQKKELLTLQDFGSKLADGNKFFDDEDFNIYQWLVQRFKQGCQNLGIKIYIDTPPVSKINPKDKKQGDWAHSHDAAVLREINKLTNCIYIDKIMPGEFLRKGKFHKLFTRQEESIGLLELYLNGSSKTEKFYLYTTAVDENHIDPILDEIWKMVPSLTLCE